MAHDESPTITPEQAPHDAPPVAPTFDDKAKDDMIAALEETKKRERLHPPKVAIYEYAKLTGRPAPDEKGADGVPLVRRFVAFYTGGTHGKKREAAALVKECGGLRAAMKEARIMNEQHEREIEEARQAAKVSGNGKGRR